MMTRRKTDDVVRELLESMALQVVDYHSTVKPTGKSIGGLIDGTAFFPGGFGVWRGGQSHGPVPEFFPEAPVMFVGHNFDSVQAHQEAQNNGGEAGSQFWKRMLGILEGASLTPEQSFFSNALMGLKPGSATGPMPRVPGYLSQCAAFLQDQVKIVRPRAVIALGVKAAPYVAALRNPSMKALHPSDWHFRETATRGPRLKLQGEQIRAFLNSLS